MMPPTPKHHPMNPMAHLRRAVTAHQAVQQGIATHAEKERVKREQHLAKLKADTGLTSQAVTQRVTLRAYPALCGDERLRVLGRHLVGGSRLAPACDLR